MAIVKWDSSFDVQVPAMNDEHAQLMKIMSQLFERNKAKASKSELQQLLQDLLSYTSQHFAHEEAFLEKINFPRLPSHRLIHERLVYRLTDLIKDFNDSHESLNPEFFDFLSFWLASHIKGIDAEYGVFAQSVKKVS